MRVLIVAKPWRGGLADYLAEAARELLGEGNVACLSTRPTSATQARARRTNKAAWEEELCENIAGSAYDVAIFLHPLARFAMLPHAEKHALWLVDDAVITADMAAAMGHVFLSDPGYAAQLEAKLPPGHYAGILPFACAPQRHRLPRTQQGRGMCFIANKDPKRTRYLKQLLPAGVGCVTYGNYFMNNPLFWHYPLAFRRAVGVEAMGDVYARHALSLNIHAEVVREGTNMRSFEAASYGVPQLVEYRPGLEQLFAPDEEILCFANAEEAIEKYSYFMRSPADFMPMAQRAQKRAVAEHTYRHRLQQILARF